MNSVIVPGVRTPFAKAGTSLKDLTAVDLGGIAVRELLARTGVPGREVGQLVYGTVLHDPHAPNIAREVGLAVLPATVPATTVSRACATANQAITDAVGLIEMGQAEVVVAGGAESLSHIPMTASDELSQVLVRASKARSLKARLAEISHLRPADLVPRSPRIAEPTTGETMGESAERMAKENGIGRAAQDAWALRSHQLAAAGTDDGRLTAEIAPVYVPPAYEEIVREDNGIRRDTSLEKLAALKPVFDLDFGSVTAGSSSPLTDGASAVLVLSEERARSYGFDVMGRVRGFAYTALDPEGQLLQGPAYAAPMALDRAGVTMEDIDVMEMHEAFSAQVLSNLQWLGSRRFAEEELGRTQAVGHPPEDRINVMGGSIAIGHPFGATGGRITTTLLNEMARRDATLGLLTVCAAGGMGFAMVLERV